MRAHPTSDARAETTIGLRLGQNIDIPFIDDEEYRLSLDDVRRLAVHLFTRNLAQVGGVRGP